MLLNIRNLPNNISLNEIRRIIYEKCGLTEVILDDLKDDGDGKRIIVGVVNECQAAMLKEGVTGLFIGGKRLSVENIRQQAQPSHNNNEQQYYKAQSMPCQNNPIMYPTPPMQYNNSYSNIPFFMSHAVGPYNYGNFNSQGAASSVQYPGFQAQKYTPNAWEQWPNMQNQSFPNNIPKLDTIPPTPESYPKTNVNVNYEQYNQPQINTQQETTIDRKSSYDYIDYNTCIEANRKGGEPSKSGRGSGSGKSRWDQSNRELRDVVRKSPSRSRKGWSPPRDHHGSRNGNRDRDYDSTRNLVYTPDRVFNRDYNLKREPQQQDHGRDNHRDRGNYRGGDRSRDRGHGPVQYGQTSSNYSRGNTARQDSGFKAQLETPLGNYSEPKHIPDYSNGPKPFNNSNKTLQTRNDANRSTVTEIKTSDEPNPAAYDPKKSNYYKVMQQINQKKKTQLSGIFESKTSNLNTPIIQNANSVPQTENSNGSVVKRRNPKALTKMAKKIVQEIIAAACTGTLVKPLLYKLKTGIRMRAREAVRNAPPQQTTNAADMYDVYRNRFSLQDDLNFFEAAKCDWRPHDQYCKDNAALVLQQKIAEGHAPIISKVSKKKKKAEAVNMPPSLPPVPDSVLLPKYPMSDKNIYKECRKQEKNEIKDGYSFPMGKFQRNAIGKEVNVLKDLFILACIPSGQDSCAKVVREEIIKGPADAFARIMSLHLSKRLSGTARPCVRISFRYKAPSRVMLTAFLKKYGVVSLKKNDKKKFYVATCNSYEGYDKLVAHREIYVDHIPMEVKPLNITFKVETISKRKTVDTQSEQTKDDTQYDQDMEESKDEVETIEPVEEIKDIVINESIDSDGIKEEAPTATLDAPLLADDLEDF